MSQDPMPPLSAEEKRIILDKGTEAPGSGRFWKYDRNGSYLCRQCGAPLFSSGQKFDSGCGWPSFDQALSGAVKESLDADGLRTEITCARCGGHLGHVFRGEGLTDKDTRHCVNSLSLAFEPEESAVFAGGCFWGVEAFFSRVPGVISVESGYSGGFMENPDYEDVCTGQSGHAEAVRIVFNPEKISYEELACLFFEIHDPTQKDRQGWDIGPQYRSAVFYADEKQRATAEKLVAELKAKGWPVETELTPLKNFYPAEEYHQKYFEKQGRGACHSRVPRFSTPYERS